MTGAFSWFLALRYLFARWVNLLGAAGVAVAVWSLIVVTAIFSGFIAEFREHIRGATADLVLTGVAERCSYAAVRQVLEQDRDVLATAPRLTHYAILFPYGSWQKPVVRTGAIGGSPVQANFVSLIGIDPEREARATELRQWLERVGADSAPARYRVPDLARPFDVPDWLHKEALATAGQEVPEGPMLSTGPGLLLSLRRMTSGERLEPGRMVDLVTSRFRRRAGQDGEREETVVKIKRPFVTAGAYATEHRVFDEVNAFVPIDTLRAMLGEDPDDPEAMDIVTEIAIKVRPEADLATVKARLAAATRDLAGGSVLTWEEQNAVFLGAIDHERAMMKVVLFAVMLVAAFLIYATLHMMVVQKIKDVGILTALGATPAGVALIFLLCGAAVAGTGSASGTVLGVLSAHYLNDVNDWLHEHFGLQIFPTELYDLDRIPYRIEADWVVTVAVAAFVLALLVAFLPAHRAARLTPVQALSYE